MNVDKSLNILCISPHVDDAELALGGTIATLSDRHTFTVLHLSDARISNTGYDTVAESRVTMSAYATVLNYAYQARKFHANFDDLIHDIYTVAQEKHYDRYYIPVDGMLHQDHQVTHTAAMAALKNTHAEIIGYQLFHDQRMVHLQHISRFDEAAFQAKLQMLKAYASQQKKTYFQDRYIRAQYELCGGEPICPLSS